MGNSYNEQFYPGNTGVTNVQMDPSMMPGVGSVAPTYSDALSPYASWDPTWGPMGGGGAWGQTLYGPTRAKAGMEPYVPPPYTGYIPLTQSDPYYTSATPLGPQNVPGNKPWEASDAQMMVGMMGSNMFPTRDQPRIMGDSGGSGGGMAKGAIQGAMIGSKFGSPWWGAAIGGGLGALGMFDTTTPPKIIPAQIKRGSRTAFPQVPPMASYYPGLLNA